MELSSIILVSILIVISLISVTILSSYLAFKLKKKQFVNPREVFLAQSKAYIYKN